MIGIEIRDRDFNVTLTNPGQSEPFLTVKGCRIVSGSKGEFVSWPARKKEDGTWWNHVYASKPFGEAVLREYRKALGEQAQKPAPARAPSRRDDFDDVPF